MNPSATPPNGQSLRCFVCSKPTDLKCCSRCRSVYYCSRDHQQSDWNRHKTFCNPLAQPTEVQSVGHPFGHHSQTHMAATSTMSTAGTVHMANATATLADPNIANQLSGHVLPTNGRTDGQTPISNINSMNGLHSPNQLIDSNQNNSQIMFRQDVILSKLNSYCESIVRDMNEFGFCVIDEFLSNGNEILDEVLLLYNHGWFKAGQVVNNRVPDTHLIRGDHIIWVDGTEQCCVNIGFLVQTLDSIVMRCNTMHTDGQLAKYRINRRTKAMIACYPGNNTQYVRHIDNPNNDGRCITSIYYLNKDYNRERDGGVLRLFPQVPQTCVADIEPKFNRVIFFWSDRRNPHEVMPSKRLRFAITVWYFDANERERALQRYRQESQSQSNQLYVGTGLQYPVDKDLRPF